MVEFDYLSKGLNAMARAHRMSSMAGHLGAAVVTGYFIGEQRPNLDPVVYRGIEGDLDRIIRGESVFGKKMSKKSPLSDSALFEPFNKEAATEGRIGDIVETLQKNVDQPRQSGHNVIFASIAVRALKEHPELATPSVIDGVCKLIRMFDKAHPGTGNFGKKRGRIPGNRITLPGDDGTPFYDNTEAMALAVMDEVIKQDPAVHRQGYGSLVHVLNHAAAIADLAQYGYGDVASAAVQSHRIHLRLWRNLPDLSEELGPMKVSAVTPHTAAYWTSGEIPYDRALLTHRVKTMFGFDELADSVDDAEKKKNAYDKLRCMM
jgi:hypothetical protein